MADLVTGNLIQSVTPTKFAQSVDTSSQILISFLRDMDRTTFSANTIALEILGTVAPVAMSFTYSNRVLTITPTAPLNPNTSYKVTLVGDVNPSADVQTANITGIRDIGGNGMIGEWSSIFTTGTVGTPTRPILVNPTTESAIKAQPNFVWTGVVGASGYDIQVSKDDTFENIFWPLDTSTWDQTQTTVTPDLPFILNQEYWWRVRAFVGAASASTYGQWSGVGNFYYGDPTYGTVTPDDAPMGLVPPTADLVQVLNTNPLPNTDNIQPVNYPTAITVIIKGPFNAEGVTSQSFWLESEPIDGEFESGNFAPIFAPSLNGAQFGAGGITVPAPVDAYQQIIVSGNLQGSSPTVVDNGDDTSTLTLPIPGGFIQDNNIYTVHLDIPELQGPLKWTFTSRWFPVFASVIAVRRMVDHFLPELDDSEIWATIRKNSLNAIFLQTYPPTQVDAESWIYNPPISFNVNNPPFFVREYTRIQTCLDFLRDLLHQAIRGGRTQLGDFSVDQESAATEGMLTLAIARLEKEIAPFLDKLHGHTNRGYARGDWAQRGQASIDDNPLRKLPFALSKRGPSFKW